MAVVVLYFLYFFDLRKTLSAKSDIDARRSLVSTIGVFFDIVECFSFRQFARPPVLRCVSEVASFFWKGNFAAAFSKQVVL